MDNSLVMFVVEDNKADVAFLNEAIEVSRISVTLHVADDGESALRFLRRQQPFSNAPRPDVMVLDLNLPAKNGKEVLMEMAADPELNTIPVAILTTSTFEHSVCRLYPSGCSVYFVKTSNFYELVEIVKRIREFAASANNGCAKSGTPGPDDK